jgi:hypothetical protein
MKEFILCRTKYKGLYKNEIKECLSPGDELSSKILKKQFIYVNSTLLDKIIYNFNIDENKIKTIYPIEDSENYNVILIYIVGEENFIESQLLSLKLQLKGDYSEKEALFI